MDYYVDTTNTINPAQNWVAVAPFEPPKPAAIDNRPTFFHGGSALTTDFFAPPKGPNAPTAFVVTEHQAQRGVSATTSGVDEKASSAPVMHVQAVSAADRIARQRVELLAAKYAGGKNVAEISARLEILNHRLTEAAPRVVASQVASLEAAGAFLQKTQAARQDRAKRLGLAV